MQKRKKKFNIIDNIFNLEHTISYGDIDIINFNQPYKASRLSSLFKEVYSNHLVFGGGLYTQPILPMIQKQHGKTKKEIK